MKKNLYWILISVLLAIALVVIAMMLCRCDWAPKLVEERIDGTGGYAPPKPVAPHELLQEPPPIVPVLTEDPHVEKPKKKPVVAPKVKAKKVTPKRKDPVIVVAPVPEPAPEPELAVEQTPEDDPVAVKIDSLPRVAPIPNASGLDFDEPEESPTPKSEPEPEIELPQKKERKGVVETDSVYHIDMLAGGPVILLSPHSKIVASLDSKFKSIYVKGRSNSEGKFRIPVPPAGTVYWKREGSPDVHTVTVLDAYPTDIRLENDDGFNQGEMITWSDADNASFYRVEAFQDPKGENLVKVFTTNEKSFDSKLFGKGHWFFRVGAMSTRLGTYEFTPIEELK